MPRGQIVRLSTRTVQATERVVDRFADAIADGIVTVDEQTELTSLNWNAYQLSQKTDVGVGVTVSILRGGIESGNARRQGFDPDSVEPESACA